jgi:hypothetical protein
MGTGGHSVHNSSKMELMTHSVHSSSKKELMVMLSIVHHPKWNGTGAIMEV